MSANPVIDSIRTTVARSVVTLRPATAADLEPLRPRSPDWHEPLIAEADGRPVGVIQIIDPTRDESHNWGCTKEGQRAIDIWIGDAVDLDRGCGTAIMKLAIELCFADPAVTAVLVDPPVNNPRVQRFYERFGFEYVARRRFGEDDCFVYRLKRPTGEPAADDGFKD